MKLIEIYTEIGERGQLKLMLSQKKIDYIHNILGPVQTCKESRLLDDIQTRQIAQYIWNTLLGD
jgi:hypothetical protein